ncbi:MAG: ABC transporter ATP-binding protein [Cyanobacteria bacterium J06635_1]
MTLNLSTEPVQGGASIPDASPTLAACNLRKVYGRGKRRFEAVREVSLAIGAGEVLAFLGPNGAGKTTTIKMIGGLVRPDAGWVRVGGLDPHRHPKALKQVGAVLEGNRNLYWRLTPEENLEYFGGLRQVPRRMARERGRQLLEQFDLADKCKTPVQKLSRGMQQKVAIAVALVHQPKLLLLDEPTLGLDVEASETVKRLIREIAASGCAILLTTHQLDVAEALSDRVAVIRKGELIAQQPTQELIRQFSGTAYHIYFDGTLNAERAGKLRSLGASLDGSRLLYSGSSAGLYDILAMLNPLPIKEIRQDKADLTQVFLQLVRKAD